MIIFWFTMNFLILFGICQAAKQSKHVTFSAFIFKATQWVPIGSYSLRFIIYTPSFILDKLLLE